MIRRITLTLGMGVAVLAAGNRQVPSQTAAGVTTAHEATAALKSGPQIPRTLRSGYIVASS